MLSMTESRTGSDPSAWRSVWLRPLNDLEAINDLLAQIHPTWSLGRIKARVLEVVEETSDTRSYVLRPNRNWFRFKAGQHLLVEVEVKGVLHQRSYSISSAPTRRRMVSITVKRQPGGKVSNWLHDHVHVGDVLTLGPPRGEFVLSEPLPSRLLMLSAGSGITPIMSMLRELAERSDVGDVEFVHVCRTRADAIFRDELIRLAETRPWLHLRFHYSAEAGRLDVGAFARLVPDYRERHTFLCGPQGFMAILQEHWEERSIAGPLQFENFGLPARRLSPADEAAVEVRCVRSERAFTTHGAGPLLVEAESAGLEPRYGCRMGICHSCQCIKRSGTVENLLTGEVSSEPGEAIQICISRARSDLVLEL